MLKQNLDTLEEKIELEKQKKKTNIKMVIHATNAGAKMTIDTVKGITESVLNFTFKTTIENEPKKGEIFLKDEVEAYIMS